MTDRIEQFLEDNSGGRDVGDYAAAVDALVATGLLSPERAETWKSEHARLLASGSVHRGPYDEEVEAKATELLEELFAPVRPKASDDWDGPVYMRYQEALLALTGIGALSHERARPWSERQQETLTPPGGWPELAPDPPEMPFAAGELSAVLTGPPDRLAGMRVTCLQLYGDCVIVQYHQLLPEEPADPVERRAYLETRFELQDDVGTVYRPAPAPISPGCRKPREGWPEVRVAWQALVPGAPLDARTFTVGWREHRYRLSHDDEER